MTAHGVNAVDAWRQSGRLFFWRFTENVRDFPGWHFMVDAAGSISLASLLRALSRSATSSIRTVQVSLPTTEVLRIPNNRGSACVAPTRLRIELDTTDAAAWSLDEDVATVHWRLGTTTAASVANALANPMEFFESSIGAAPALWSWGLLPESPADKPQKRMRGR
jgi:hypothetical protein